VKDFYDLPDGKEHPKPSLEYLEWQKQKDAEREVDETAQWAEWSKPGKPEP
jgi:hypothetical protein